MSIKYLIPRIQKNILYRLFLFFSKKSQIQIFILIFLQIINGIFESFSIAAIVPFISILATSNNEIPIPIFGNLLTFFGITYIPNSFFFVTFYFCLFIILSTFFRIFNLRYIFKLKANLEIELSRIIFKDNILQTYTNYSKKNSSEIIDIIIGKVTSTSNALCSLLISIGSVILGIFIIGALLIISWKIILLEVIFLAIYYLSIYKKVNKTLYRNGQLIASVSPIRLRLIQEVFQGFRDIVVNGTEKTYINIFNKIDSEYKLIDAKSSFIKLFPRYLVEGFAVLILIIVGYNLSILNFNLLSFIPIFGSAIYALQKLLPLIQLSYGTLADYKVRFESIHDVVKELEFNKSIRQRNKKKDNLSFHKSIELKNICFSYDTSNYILNNINLRINKGEHIGIIGKTGSGKSTLLDIIIGLLTPTKGDILIDDFNLYKGVSDFNWSKKISCVSQNIFLKEGTIAENIAFGESHGEFDLELLSRASKIAQIYEFINQTKLGFETKVGERGLFLSGGQRQRIAIARALYKVREILVLDEATSALDYNTEKKIINSIRNNSNLTILMVSHNLESLGNCDRLLEVKDNQLIEINKKS